MCTEPLLDLVAPAHIVGTGMRFSQVLEMNVIWVL